MTGTVAISWGPSGGFYLHRDFSWRVCLWRFALTYCPVELDDMMEAYAERGAWTAQRTPDRLCRSYPEGGWIVTYHPDSVLVEKVAKAQYDFDHRGLDLLPYEEVGPRLRAIYVDHARRSVEVACPLVAGVIADRLDEETGGDSKDRWAAEFVRSEFVDGEA